MKRSERRPSIGRKQQQRHQKSAAGSQLLPQRRWWWLSWSLVCWWLLLLLLLLQSSTAAAQTTTTTTAGTATPDVFGSCLQDLKQADANKDGKLSDVEFLSSIRLLSGGIDAASEVAAALALLPDLESALGSGGIDLTDATSVAALCNSIYNGILKTVGKTVTAQSCNVHYLLSDTDPSSYRDSVFTQTEYARFVSRLSDGKYSTNTPINELPQSVQDIFNYFANPATGTIDIFGGKAQNTNATAAQKELALDLCRQTTVAVVLAALSTSSPAAPSATTQAPRTKQPAAPTSPSGQQYSFTYAECKKGFALSDASRDGFLNQNEFFNLVKKLSSNQLDSSVTSFATLPPALQSLYTELAKSNGDGTKISVQGGAPGQTATPDQQTSLEHICNATQDAMNAQSNTAATTAGFTFSFQECLDSCKNSTSNNDGFLNKREYARLIEFLGNYTFVGFLGAMPQPIQDTFLNLTTKYGDGSMISIAGLGDPAMTTDQQANLEAVCLATQKAMNASLPSVPAPATSPPASAPTVTPTANTTTIDMDKCKRDMFISDLSRDSQLDQKEFVRFLSRRTTTIAMNQPFETIPQAYQDLYTTLAASSGDAGTINVSGAKGTAADSTQQAFLVTICTSTEKTIQSVTEFPPTMSPNATTSPVLVPPTTAPPSVPSAAATPSPTGPPSEVANNESSAIMTVYNAFVVADLEGLGAASLASGPNRGALNDAYEKFVNEIVDYFVSSSMTSNETSTTNEASANSGGTTTTDGNGTLAPSTSSNDTVTSNGTTTRTAFIAPRRPDVFLRGGGSSRRILEVIGLVPSSVGIFDIVNTACPENVIGAPTTVCVATYASFDVNIKNESYGEMLTAYAQDAVMRDNLLQSLLEEADPNATIMVVGTTATKERSQEVTQAPQNSDNGGGGGSGGGKGGIIAMVTIIGIAALGACGYYAYNKNGGKHVSLFSGFSLPKWSPSEKTSGDGSGPERTEMAPPTEYGFQDTSGKISDDEEAGYASRGGSVTDEDKASSEPGSQELSPERSRIRQGLASVAGSLAQGAKTVGQTVQTVGQKTLDTGVLAAGTVGTVGLGLVGTATGGLIGGKKKSGLPDRGEDHNGAAQDFDTEEDVNNYAFDEPPAASLRQSEGDPFTNNNDIWNSEADWYSGTNAWTENGNAGGGGGNGFFESNDDGTPSYDDEESGSGDESYVDDFTRGDTISRSGIAIMPESKKMRQLDALVDKGDWDGVMEAAAQLDDNFDDSFTPSKEDASVASGHKFDDSTGGQSSEERRREQYRKQVEMLVKKCAPDEIDNIDVMMKQFAGREAELINTLQTMSERASSQRAIRNVHKSKGIPERENRSYTSSKASRSSRSSAIAAASAMGGEAFNDDDEDVSGSGDYSDEEESNYDDDQQEGSFADAKSGSRSGGNSGSFDGGGFDEDGGFDDGGSRPSHKDSRGSKEEDLSGTGSYDDEERSRTGSYDDEEDRSRTGSYDDEERSRTGSYDDEERSRTGSYDDEDRSRSGSYDDEDRSHSGSKGHQTSGSVSYEDERSGSGRYDGKRPGSVRHDDERSGSRSGSGSRYDDDENSGSYEGKRSGSSRRSSGGKQSIASRRSSDDIQSVSRRSSGDKQSVSRRSSDGKQSVASRRSIDEKLSIVSRRSSDDKQSVASRRSGSYRESVSTSPRSTSIREKGSVSSRRSGSYAAEQERSRRSSRDAFEDRIVEEEPSGSGSYDDEERSGSGSYDDRGSVRSGSYDDHDDDRSGSFDDPDDDRSGSYDDRGSVRSGSHRSGSYDGSRRSGSHRSGSYSGRSGSHRSGSYDGSIRSGSHRSGSYDGSGRSGSHRSGSYDGSRRSGSHRSGSYSGHSGSHRSGSYDGSRHSGSQRSGSYDGSRHSGSQRSGSYDGSRHSRSYDGSGRSGSHRSGSYDGSRRSGSHRSGSYDGSGRSGSHRSGSYDDEGSRSYDDDEESRGSRSYVKERPRAVVDDEEPSGTTTYDDDEGSFEGDDRSHSKHSRDRRRRHPHDDDDDEGSYDDERSYDDEEDGSYDDDEGSYDDD